MYLVGKKYEAVSVVSLKAIFNCIQICKYIDKALLKVVHGRYYYKPELRFSESLDNGELTVRPFKWLKAGPPTSL